MIHLHRAERADRLVAALADVLAEPLADPMATEVVAVPSRGIERWIAQELSARLGAAAGRGDGVCANVDFPFPARVVGRVLAAAGAVDPDDDPWHPERLVWHVLEVLDARLDEPWLAPLRVHLGEGDADATRRGRRYGAARHIADLFDRYAVHRPELLLGWAQGAAQDDPDARLDRDTAWQRDLWRTLHERLPIPSPAERVRDAAARVRDGLEVPDLPPRLALFGLTALPSSYVDVLAALATTRDVHLFLLHPSPTLWDRVRDVLPASLPRRPGRDDDPTRDLPRHPLLASWGRDAREMQLVVAAAGVPTDAAAIRPPRRPAPSTLLARIQADVADDRPPLGPAPAGGGNGDGAQARLPLGAVVDDRPLLDPTDRSLQVHACHGRTRQVEVLRDAILHLLADDPTLEPRDIVVMCPDIEDYAPIVHAVFGAAVVVDRDTTDDDADRLPDLRVRLADRSIRQTNPVLRVVAELLELADGRLTASDVLALASRGPVRRRFRLDDDDLERLATWVAQARVRWGLDGDHRAAFGLAGVDANTWRAGLDRLLLGVTMADEEDRLVGGAVPLDDVEGDDVDLAGRVAELVDRLDDAVAALRGPHPVGGWADAVDAAADLLTATDEHDRWQRLQLQRILDEVVRAADTGAGAPGGRRGPQAPLSSSDVPLTLPEVRSLLGDRLRGRPSRANHRTGDLTVCTLVPMRSVPHRVVCLLGMDDGTFPRRTGGDGDDLLDRDPLVGDRDPRTEDRQLLLDALLAAQQTLVITYTGRDERTNERRPPAVPVGELLDVVDRTVRTAEARPASRAVAVEHPLQPFDPRNFTDGALVPGLTWGHDPVALAGARAKARGDAVPPAFLPKPLDRDEEPVVELDALVRFFDHPVKGFLHSRLGVFLGRPGDQPSDAIPVELPPLDEYAVGDRLLAARRDGADVERWLAAERARGVLPPGALADSVLARVTETVDELLAAAAEHVALDGEARAVDVDVPLGETSRGDGRRLVGTVPSRRGDVLVTLQYSRVKPKHRLAAWIRLLAATAAEPDRPLVAVTVGRVTKKGYGKNPKVATVSRLEPPEGTAEDRRRWAREGLGCLLDLYDRGRCEPLPLFPAASAAYAEAVAAGKDPVAAARGVWSTDWKYPKEDRDPEHVLVLGPDAALEDLLRDPPTADEEGAGWVAEETSRFGRCARRLWDGLLAAEEVTDR